jgi:hypothetical protein
MALYDDILAAAPADRPRLRSIGLTSLGRKIGRTVTRGEYTFTLMDGPDLVGNDVRIVVGIERGGVDVTPPSLNPVIIRNIPILVPDGGSIVIVDRGTFRVDPLAVLDSIVARLV